MSWLKHIFLIVAATVMVAVPAMACCNSDHAAAAPIADAPDVAASHSQAATGMPAAHDCGGEAPDPVKQAGAHQQAPVAPQPDDGCAGCADCASATVQSKTDIAAIEARGDQQPQQATGGAAIALPIRPAAAVSFWRPTATAPPPKSPVSLRQRLVV